MFVIDNFLLETRGSNWDVFYESMDDGNVSLDGKWNVCNVSFLKSIMDMDMVFELIYVAGWDEILGFDNILINHRGNECVLRKNTGEPMNIIPWCLRQSHGFQNFLIWVKEVVKGVIWNISSKGRRCLGMGYWKGKMVCYLHVDQSKGFHIFGGHNWWSCHIPGSLFSIMEATM